jgi:2-keto-4-pentenoate hydratase
MLSDKVRKEAANALADAEAKCAPIEPLSELWPELDVADAYEIQLTNIGARIAEGRRVKGHKVGLTARAMQRMLGVNEPDYGLLLDDMFVLESAEIDTVTLCQPRVEVEVAFVLGQSLRGPGVTMADVLRATEFVVPALEIIDSRIRDWRITLADTIADNASSARVVLGGKRTSITDLDLRTIGAVLSIDGGVVGTGASGAVLGNPATALAWLANKIASFDGCLDAGHVIMPGSCTRAFDVRPGTTVLAELDQLGSVAVGFT